jgi:hypothetical protein
LRVNATKVTIGLFSFGSVALSGAAALLLGFKNADSFVRFAELQLLDIANVWKIAGPESRQRVQNLLFQDGLHYSPESGILNRSKSCLFSVLEATKDEKGLLASPTGFEPVLSP